MSTENEIIDLRPKTHRAVQAAASRYGIRMPDSTAAAIAEAVLECADDEYRVSYGASAEIWEKPEARDAITTSLKRQMAVDLVNAEMLPTALPRQVVTRPAYPWELVKVELVVPVRKPPPSR